MQHKTITQSTIRSTIYDNVMATRNMGISELANYYEKELERLIGTTETYKPLQPMFNWSYGHYFFARILYYLNPLGDFADMLRSRKQTSYILCQLFEGDDWEGVDEELVGTYSDCVGNHFLIRRKDYKYYRELGSVSEKIGYVMGSGLVPELNGKTLSGDMLEFLKVRDLRLQEIASEIWNARMVDEKDE